VRSAPPRGATSAASSDAAGDSVAQSVRASIVSSVSRCSNFSHISCLSAGSSPNAQHRCYLSGTLFLSAPERHEAPSIADLQLVPATQLQLHSWVRGAFGMVQVSAIQVDPMRTCRLFQLCVDGRPLLTVTESHRIVVAIDGRRTSVVLAEELQPGDQILCSNWSGDLGSAACPVVPMLLRDVRSFSLAVDVVLVRFQPDEPVEAFDLSSAILSKGYAPGRRGGRRRRQERTAEVASIPDTEYDDGW